MKQTFYTAGFVMSVAKPASVELSRASIEFAVSNHLRFWNKRYSSLGWYVRKRATLTPQTLPVKFAQALRAVRSVANVALRLLKMVDQLMRRFRKHHEVLWPVVRFDSVDVMNRFVGFEPSTNFLFRHQTMLKDVRFFFGRVRVTFCKHTDVALSCNTSASFESRSGMRQIKVVKTRKTSFFGFVFDFPDATTAVDALGELRRVAFFHNEYSAITG